MREICTSGSEGGGGFSLSLPLSPDFQRPPDSSTIAPTDRTQRERPMAYTVLPYSTFLDYTSYGTTTATNVADAYHLSDIHTASASDTINVAFILPRANDPTALLDSNWATRQTPLHPLNDSRTLWSTYAASASGYNNALSVLHGMGHVLGLDANDPYVTSQASRTIWVSLTATQFHDVFNTTLLQGTTPEHETLYFWNGP